MYVYECLYVRDGTSILIEVRYYVVRAHVCVCVCVCVVVHSDVDVENQRSYMHVTL